MPEFSMKVDSIAFVPSEDEAPNQTTNEFVLRGRAEKLGYYVSRIHNNIILALDDAQKNALPLLVLNLTHLPGGSKEQATARGVQIVPVLPLES